MRRVEDVVGLVLAVVVGIVLVSLFMQVLDGGFSAEVIRSAMGE